MTNKHFLLLLSILFVLSLFINLGIVELEAEEPRRAIVAIEMMLRGEFIIPQINGWNYYNKPPVFNWLLASFFMLSGSYSEFMVRLPGLLSFLAMGGINYWFVKKYVNKETALYASLFFLTSIDIYFYGIMHAGEIDIFFSLLTFLQIVSIFHFYEQKKWTWLFLISYAITGLGILTKGAPSILFQGITLVFFLLIYKKEWRNFFSLKHIAGILLCLGLVSVYFYAYYTAGGNLSAYLTNLFKEASQKSGLESSFWGMAKNIVWFPVNLIKITLPWSLLFFLFFIKYIRQHSKQNPYISFSLLFILPNIVVYWITDKPANRYIYMFLPFLFGVLAYAYSLLKPDKLLRPLGAIALGSISIVSIGLYFFNANYITSYYGKVSLFVLLSVLVLYLFIRFKPNVLFSFAFGVVLVRMAMAVFYLPYRQESRAFSYRETVQDLFVLTQHKPILLAGVPYQFDSDASIGPIHFHKDVIQTAPLIAYQIPYYQTVTSNKTMQFEEQMQPDTYYLMYSSQADTNTMHILKTFRENWQGDLQLSLVYLK